MKNHSLRFLAIVAFALFHSAPARAQFNFTPGDVSALAGDHVEALLELSIIGADHRAYLPATALGSAIGLDIGVEVTGINIPASVREAMTTANVSQEIPSLIPLPRISVHKGLPFGFDVGFSFISLQDNRIIGADVKWAPMPGGVGEPALAFRLSGNWSRLFFMRSRTVKLDTLVSKRLGVIDPYLGLGLQTGSGSLAVPVGGATGLQVQGDKSITAMHIYAGLPLIVGFTTITAEYDYSFAGISTLGLKLSLSM